MEIRYKAEAIKELKKIGTRDKPKVKKKIELLTKNPLVGKPLAGRFRGLYSLRAWPLRVIYSYDRKRQVVTIEAIGYRGDIYKLC